MADERTVAVGKFQYVRRDYTPKRRNGPAGHGWIRQDPRAEVGQEVCTLVDEIVRLRAAEAAK